MLTGEIDALLDILVFEYSLSVLNDNEAMIDLLGRYAGLDFGESELVLLAAREIREMRGVDRVSGLELVH